MTNRFFLIAVLVLLVGLGSRPTDAAVSLRYLAPESACPGSSQLGQSLAVQERQMRCLIAYARQKAKVPRVRRNSQLVRSTKIKARLIVRCRAYSHTPCGLPAARSFQLAGYGPGFDGSENIAASRASLDSPRSVMRSWLQSKTGHGENVIDPRWREFALTLRRGNIGAGAELFWVSQFGVRY